MAFRVAWESESRKVPVPVVWARATVQGTRAVVDVCVLGGLCMSVCPISRGHTSILDMPFYVNDININTNPKPNYQNSHL